MARIDIIIAKLPALIADRTDALKVETAIRYVGDIIFDASQDRGGDKANAFWTAHCGTLDSGCRMMGTRSSSGSVSTTAGKP